MLVSYKTPFKPFKTGICQKKGPYFLWKFVRASTRESDQPVPGQTNPQTHKHIQQAPFII